MKSLSKFPSWVRKALTIGIAFCFVIFAFFIYQYFWGNMYGGRAYQLRSVKAEAKVLLSRYCREQKRNMEHDKKYERNLHKRSDYRNTRYFTLGYNDDLFLLEKLCKDCTFSMSSFKIGAVSVSKDVGDGKILAFSIDQDCNLQEIEI